MDTINSVLRVIAAGISVLAIIPIGLFIYYYGTRAIPGRKWRRTYSNSWKLSGIGRTMMYQKIAWLVFLIWSGINLAVPPYGLQDELRLVIYFFLFFLFWKMFFNLRAVQRAGTKSTASVNPEDTKAQRDAYNASSSIEETGSIPVQKDPPKQ